MASDPELLERPAPAKSKAKAKAPVRKRGGPTISSLRAKVERAAQQGGNRKDIGALSHAQRDKILFGN